MARASRLVDRVPTRVRVTVAFTAVMALLLAGAGLFLYLRLGSTLQATVDRGLRSRAGDVTALIRQADSGLAQAGHSPLTDQGESLAQILDSRGRVVDALPTLRAHPLLTASEVRRAMSGTIIVEHDTSPGEPDRVRLLATPVSAQGHRLLVVVGSSLDPVTEAQSELGRLLVVGGPIALLIASLAGYGLFQHAAPGVVAFVLTFAAGAILTMLADTMMPEAFQHASKWAGVLTTLGFAVAFTIHLLD